MVQSVSFLLFVAGVLPIFVFSQAHATSDLLGVFTNVPETADENYFVLYELEPPVNGGFSGSTPVPYSVDNRDTVPAFDRIAYYLELTREDETKWVYASMDAFSEDATAIGLPHNQDNPVAHQQNVRNMTVASNVSEIVTGAFIDTGHVEMWPGNYAIEDAYGVYASSDDLYDWGDGPPRIESGYGTFQIHNPLARQTLLAYNHWGFDSDEDDDIGIGNQPEGNPDWTFAENTADFIQRRLVILVRPRTCDVSFTQLPRDRQLYPRDPDTNTAAVAIAGTESYGGFDEAVLRISRAGVLIDTITQTLDYQNGTAQFAFNPEITAQLAGYDFELLLVQGESFKTVELVRDVVAGDAFIFYGQSNAEAASYDSDRSANEYASQWLRTFGQNGDGEMQARNILYWTQAEGDGFAPDPSSIGQWAMVLGRQIIDTYGIPVAVLNGSRGGYSIGRLQKDRSNPDILGDATNKKRPYNRLRYRAIQSGLADKARAMFYYQGESDKDDEVVHAEGFADLQEDWAVDYPGLEQVYVTQIRVGCIGVAPSDVELRDVQRRFADVYPNTSVMASNGIPNHNGCHYLFTEGYEKLGFHHYRVIARDLYGSPDDPDIDPLNVNFVEFTDSSRTELKLVLRNVGATIKFPIAALEDFAITDTETAITDRTVSEHHIFLQLSEPAEEGSTLEYRAHLDDGDWITNANGVGLLTFVEPIAPPLLQPGIVLHKPNASREAEIGETVPIEAVATSSPENPVVRTAFYVNGVLQMETSNTSLITSWEPPTRGAYRLTVRAFDDEGNFWDDSVAVLAATPFPPAEIASGLKIWLKAEKGITRASGNFIAEWQDQSGYDHHVTQPDTSARPEFAENLYGPGPGIRFDGNDFLTSDLGMPTGDYTKIVRFTLTSDDAKFGHNLVSSAESGSSSSPQHALYLPQLRPTLFHKSDFVSGNTPVALNQSVVIIASYNSANLEGILYLDGESIGSGIAVGDNTKSSFQVGAYNGDHHMHGSIAEVMVYDRVLTDHERNSIAAYLAEKYRTPFELWQEQFGLGEAGAPDLDFDRDGLPNSMEYVLGLNPALPDAISDRLPRINRNGPNIEVTYNRPLDRPDAAAQLERSEDLNHWFPVEDLSIANDGTTETRFYAENVTGTNSALFFRLRVTIPIAP